MPDEIPSDISRERGARWKYIVRHPDFRKELREIRKLYKNQGAVSAETPHQAFVRKWGLQDFPFDILTKNYIPDDIPLKNAFYETFCHSAPICPPVQLEEERRGFVTPSGRHRGEFITITVDLSYPSNLLLSAIKDELLAIRAEAPRQRHHRDKTDDYLDVYDRAEQGETYQAMAHALGESIPTLKSRLRAACRNIYGDGKIPQKWKLQTIGMDAATHLEHCTQCQNAQADDEMCPQGQAYVDQDTAGQVERAVRDEIVHSAPAPEDNEED